MMTRVNVEPMACDANTSYRIVGCGNCLDSHLSVHGFHSVYNLLGLDMLVWDVTVTYGLENNVERDGRWTGLDVAFLGPLDHML